MEKLKKWGFPWNFKISSLDLYAPVRNKQPKLNYS